MLKRGDYQIIEINQTGRGDRVEIRSCLGRTSLDKNGLPLFRIRETKTEPVKVLSCCTEVKAQVLSLLRPDISSVFIRDLLGGYQNIDCHWEPVQKVPR